MSERLQGWVECRNSNSYWFHDEWVATINVESIMNDEDLLIIPSLFPNVIPPNHTGPLAPGKGLPPDVSELVAHEAGRWQTPWFCAYLTWAELVPLRNRQNFSPDWQLLLELMRTLAAAYSDANVRLILWTYITDYS
jgi:hypothetical protein